VDIAELRRELTTEKVRTKTLTEEIKNVKAELVKLQSVVEQEDEYRVNKLSKTLDQLKKEKSELLVLVEQEEEYITNTLSRRLEQVRKEKIDIENQLEQEEEFISNKLQKQLNLITQDKKNLEKRLEEESFVHDKLKKMGAEVTELKTILKQYETEQIEYVKKNDELKDQLLKLKTENFTLSQRIKREQEKMVQVNSEKLKLMSSLEVGDEKRYNTKSKTLGPHLRTRSTSLPPSETRSPPHLNNNNNNNNNTPNNNTLQVPRLQRAKTPPPPSSWNRGRVVKETACRFKEAHSTLPGFVVIRDLGLNATTALQVWRKLSAKNEPEGAPDVVCDVDNVDNVERDKTDPRCVVVQQKQHDTLTFVFDNEEQASEWATLLTELRFS